MPPPNPPPVYRERATDRPPPNPPPEYRERATDLPPPNPPTAYRERATDRPPPNPPPEYRERAADLYSCLIVIAFFWSVAIFAQENPGAPPQMEGLAEKASAIRQLEFKEPLQFGKFQTAAELREFFGREFDRAYPPEMLGWLNKAYLRLGLLKPGEEFRKSVMDMMVSQVGGLYDPHTKKMYIVWDLSPDLYTVQTIFIHEIVHALQDQHFDLLKLPIEELHRDDVASAAMALVEGDATHAMMEYRPEEVNPLSLSAELFLTLMLSSGEYESAPPVLQKRTLFAYLAGMGFVKQLIEKGGYDALNAAYADPPVSSEQILHPEKYLAAERDVPQRVEIPDATAALGAGWRMVYYNEMGELGVSALLDQKLTLTVSANASEGWDGDVYALLVNSASGEELLLWESVWDSPKDAQEFYKAHVKFTAKLAGESGVEPLPSETWRRGPFLERERFQAVKNDRVIILDGSKASIDAVLPLFAGWYETGMKNK